MIEVRLETHPARRLLARSHTGDYRQIGDAFERIRIKADALRLSGPFIGVYYHNPDTTPLDKLRSHAGVVDAPRLQPHPGRFRDRHSAAW